MRDWLFSSALPFWSTIGSDGEYGFVEHLTLEAKPASVDYKRLRVQARQTYVFSHGHVLGFEKGLDAAANGWQFMVRHAWRDDLGWARRVGRYGGVKDGAVDLYDQAFALLAIAWWVRASGDSSALTLADRTLEVIDERLTRDGHLGWVSDDGPAPTRDQNPHMHMLEALLALEAVSPSPEYRSRIMMLLELAESHLFDPLTGTLAEYYAADWSRVDGDRGRIVEPGHHYEWTWLLHQAEQLVPGAATLAQPLLDFAEQHGVDSATGLIYDEILDDGSVRSGSFRSWPNTEALKAHLAVFEATGELRRTRLEQIADNILVRYLDVPVRGTWVDQLDESARPAADKIPSSTLYHLFVAMSEFLRLTPATSSTGRRDGCR